MPQITDESRIKVQQLLRDVLLVFDNIAEVEKTLTQIKKEATKEYKKLDDMLDG